MVRSKKLAGRVKWTRMMRFNARSLAQQPVQQQVAGCETEVVCASCACGAASMCGPVEGSSLPRPQPAQVQYSARQSARQSGCRSLIAQ